MSLLVHANNSSLSYLISSSIEYGNWLVLSRLFAVMGRSRELGEKDDRKEEDSPLSSFPSPLVLLSTALLSLRELIE